MGGGYSPLYTPHRYVRLQRVFFEPFWSEIRYRFRPFNFGLKMGEVQCAFLSGIGYLVVVIATTRYYSGVKRIPEHIPVVIFVSCRVDS